MSDMCPVRTSSVCLASWLMCQLKPWSRYWPCLPSPLPPRRAGRYLTALRYMRGLPANSFAHPYILSMQHHRGLWAWWQQQQQPAGSMADVALLGGYMRPSLIMIRV